MKIFIFFILLQSKLFSAFLTSLHRIHRTSFPVHFHSYDSEVDKDETARNGSDEIIEEGINAEVGDEAEKVEDDATEEKIDLEAQAIEKYEKVLKQQVELFENTLRSERISASKARDKLSESGKAGYFMVQAQVNDFLRKSDAAQKDRVIANKREFVKKMLPIIDSFRNTPLTIPADTETGQNMHTGFGALLTGILNVIDKYGFKEFVPDLGDLLDPVKHTVESVVEVEGATDGTVSAVILSGFYDFDGSVLRRATVIGTKAPTGSESESEVPTEDKELQ